MTLTIKKEKTMPNYDKLRLGRTLSSPDGDNNNHGDCFNYGSVGIVFSFFIVKVI